VKEELRLITSESELKVGMLVECRGCMGCGGHHRYQLLRYGGVYEYLQGPGHGWLTAPEPCQILDRPARLPACFDLAISERRLYEVREAGQDDEAERREWGDLVRDSQCRIRKPRRVDP
jgi:hypothetical protein